MKIGVVGTVGLTPAKNSQKPRSNSNYKISFGSVEQDCFVKRDRAQIFENMKFNKQSFTGSSDKMCI